MKIKLSYTFFYKKHFYKKHEAEIRQKLRNIQETQEGFSGVSGQAVQPVPLAYLKLSMAV